MLEICVLKNQKNISLFQALAEIERFKEVKVTLEEIAQIVREGNEIQVIDNKTKNDITYITQIQLLFDQERKALKLGDTDLLKKVIRSNEGTLTGYIRNLEDGKYGTPVAPAAKTPVLTENSQEVVNTLN